MALNLTFHNGKRVESFSFTLAVPDGFDVLQNIGERKFIIWKKMDGLPVCDARSSSNMGLQIYSRTLQELIDNKLSECVSKEKFIQIKLAEYAGKTDGTGVRKDAVKILDLGDNQRKAILIRDLKSKTAMVEVQVGFKDSEVITFASTGNGENQYFDDEDIYDIISTIRFRAPVEGLALYGEFSPSLKGQRDLHSICDDVKSRVGVIYDTMDAWINGARMPYSELLIRKSEIESRLNAVVEKTAEMLKKISAVNVGNPLLLQLYRDLDAILMYCTGTNVSWHSKESSGMCSIRLESRYSNGDAIQSVLMTPEIKELQDDLSSTHRQEDGVISMSGIAPVIVAENDFMFDMWWRNLTPHEYFTGRKDCLPDKFENAIDFDGLYLSWPCIYVEEMRVNKTNVTVQLNGYQFWDDIVIPFQDGKLDMVEFLKRFRPTHYKKMEPGDFEVEIYEKYKSLMIKSPNSILRWIRICDLKEESLSMASVLGVNVDKAEMQAKDERDNGLALLENDRACELAKVDRRIEEAALAENGARKELESIREKVDLEEAKNQLQAKQEELQNVGFAFWKKKTLKGEVESLEARIAELERKYDERKRLINGNISEAAAAVKALREEKECIIQRFDEKAASISEESRKKQYLLIKKQCEEVFLDRLLKRVNSPLSTVRLDLAVYVEDASYDNDMESVDLPEPAVMDIPTSVPEVHLKQPRDTSHDDDMESVEVSESTLMDVPASVPEVHPKQAGNTAITPIGQEPPRIKSRISVLFAKLDTAYPDKQLVQLGKNHKQWNETASEIGHALGYETGAQFLTAYGYTCVQGKGGRPNTGAVSEVIEELKRRYGNRPRPKTIVDLQEENPDLAGKFKNMANGAKERWGMTLQDYLVEQGILEPGRNADIMSEAEFDAAIATLAGCPKQNSYPALKAANPGTPFDRMEEYIRNVLKTRIVDYYTSTGLIFTKEELDARKAQKAQQKRAKESLTKNPQFKINSKGILSKCTCSEEVLFVPEGVVCITSRAFAGHDEIREIHFPSTLEVIEHDAFKELKGLRTVHFSEGLREIGDSAFFSCPALEAAQLPEGLVLLKRWAFRNCTALKSVTVPGTVRNPGPAVFEGCYALTDVVLNEGLTQLSNEMFGDCGTEAASPLRVNFPASLRIVNSSFTGCNLEKEVVLSPGAVYVHIEGNRVFGTTLLQEF